MDLAILSADGATLSITRNTLDGLSTLDAELTGLTAARQLQAVDWDGDAKADLLGQEGDTLKVWLGRGDATFADPVILGAALRYLQPADFDGDGKPDLAVLTDDASHLVFSRNTSAIGSPSLAAGQPIIGGWATMHQLMTGDFDGDTRADIIGRSGGVLQVWLSASTPEQWAFLSYVALTRLPVHVGELGWHELPRRPTASSWSYQVENGSPDRQAPPRAATRHCTMMRTASAPKTVALSHCCRRTRRGRSVSQPPMRPAASTIRQLSVTVMTICTPPRMIPCSAT